MWSSNHCENPCWPVIQDLCSLFFWIRQRLTQKKETACMQTDGSATFCYSFAVALTPFEGLLLLGTRVKSCPSWCSSLPHLLFPRQISTDVLCWPCHGLLVWAFSFSVFLLLLSWTQLWIHCLCCPLLCFTTSSVLQTSKPQLYWCREFLSLFLWTELCGRRWELSSSFWMRVQPEGN